MNAWISPSHLGVLVPILIVCGGIVVALVAIIVLGRNKDLEHRERLVAMEKGIPLPEPPPPPEKKQKPLRPPYWARRAWGLVLIGIGLALFIILGAVTELKHGSWGLLPLFMGIALYIGASLDKREFLEREKYQESIE
jgi:hypothetical protein